MSETTHIPASDQTISSSSTPLIQPTMKLNFLPQPIPLRYKVQAEDVAFPVEELTSTLRGATEAIVDKVQLPIEIAANAVLSVASLAAQQHADVITPNGIKSPLSLFMLSVAKPSERKSTADNFAMQCVREYERQREISYNNEISFYKTIKAAWYGSQQSVINSRKTDHKQKQEELAKLGPEPLEPIDWKLVCSEPTIEGLLNQFRYGYPSLGLFNNDGASFLGGYSLSKDHRLKTAGKLSSLWNATPTDITLKNRQENCRIANRRLALHLMIQPEVAKQFFAIPEFKGQGLLSRFLISWPESTMGTRFSRAEDAESAIKLDAYNQQLLRVFQKPFNIIFGTRQELNPTLLTLDAECKKEWEQYVDYIEHSLARGAKYEGISDFAGKAVEQALRLAGVMTIIENPDAITIHKHDLWRASNIMEYYLSQQTRLFDSADIPTEILEAEELLEWMRNSYEEDHISMTEITHEGPHRLRTTALAQRTVRTLVAHNWLFKVNEPITIRGRRIRSDAWFIQR